VADAAASAELQRSAEVDGAVVCDLLRVVHNVSAQLASEAPNVRRPGKRKTHSTPPTPVGASNARRPKP